MEIKASSSYRHIKKTILGWEIDESKIQFPDLFVVPNVPISLVCRKCKLLTDLAESISFSKLLHHVVHFALPPFPPQKLSYFDVGLNKKQKWSYIHKEP